ncbi:hypothetical protein K1T71_012416 [Dendrolimus kikuchii]|uniref:Uncharacterized protein n=1 Tax=Dendrolimus kikuchii TaxID=765133 RepID=A0ACC1CJA3_9NEOP|nr:hypothetical protein K1T71_012416 [Dendrolimus kikuchii]
MEIGDETNYSDETLYHISEEHTDEEKIVVKSKVQNLETSPRALKQITFQEGEKSIYEKPIVLKLEDEVKSLESLNSVKSERLRKLSQQLPKIIITSSTTSLDMSNENRVKPEPKFTLPRVDKLPVYNITRSPQAPRTRKAYGEFPKRLVSKTGLENVALISNVPFEKIRLLNDTFHTLINLRWRWIVIGTVVVHFLIWLVFAMFWYITALAHYDFEPDPPKRSCVTGGKDFVTIFLASVEAQTTIGFGDRAIDEECPEAIFLFIMQLILGTGLSGVLTCVVYAKLTRPEKLSRDGVGFSKKAVISMRDGRLCLMIRAWDLNYDHIISSEFTQRQFLLWPVTLVHVIDHDSPLYRYGPDVINHSSYEITVSLKGASASMGTFTQSQTSYLPKEIIWGHRFPPVVKYDCRKQKYVIDHKKLDLTEAVDTPQCSAELLDGQSDLPIPAPSTLNNFSDKMTVFQLGRTSSFRNKKIKT